MIEGDRVVWFKNSKRGRIISCSKNFGTIKRIDGEMALVITECGGRVRKSLSELKLRSDDSCFSIVENVAKALANK